MPVRKSSTSALNSATPKPSNNEATIRGTASKGDSWSSTRCAAVRWVALVTSRVLTDLSKGSSSPSPASHSAATEISRRDLRARSRSRRAFTPTPLLELRNSVVFWSCRRCTSSSVSCESAGHASSAARSPRGSTTSLATPNSLSEASAPVAQCARRCSSCSARCMAPCWWRSTMMD